MGFIIIAPSIVQKVIGAPHTLLEHQPTSRPPLGQNRRSEDEETLGISNGSLWVTFLDGPWTVRGVRDTR